MNALEIAFNLYVIFVLITSFCIVHWLFIALRWQWGYMREHGFKKCLWDCYHPLQGWKNIRRIWQEVPGSKAVFKRGFFLLCVTSVFFQVWRFLLR